MPPQSELLKTLSRSWPDEYRVDSLDSIESIPKHPFKGELIALRDGNSCSLPFYGAEKITFLTMAPNVTDFNNEINLIRAWIIPSFAWEKFDEGPGSSIVTKRDPTNTLSPVIFKLSPSGYFRWAANINNEKQVYQKLKEKRTLSENQPKNIFLRSKHLPELREQLFIGMTTGDYESSKNAIDEIHHHKLDRASNIYLMKIRLFDKFRMFEEIVKFEGLERLLSLSIVKSIKGMIASAFYNFYLKELEDININESIEKYKFYIHDILSNSLNHFKVSDGLIYAKLLLYKAVVSVEGRGLYRLIQNESNLKNDPIVKQLLNKLSRDSLLEEPSKDRFYRLYKNREWLRLHELTLGLIKLNKIGRSDLQIFESLKKSLNYCANEALQTKLVEIFGTFEIDMPQNWKEFCEALKAKDYKKAKLFLQCGERVDVSQSDETDIIEVINLIHFLVEEIETRSDNSYEILEIDIIERTLSLIIDEVINESEFPRSEREDSYFKIFQIWFLRKLGSLKPHDWSLLLALADGLLEISDDREREIINNLRECWEKRKVPGNLDYLLNSIELISERSQDRNILVDMWMDGAIFIDSTNCNYILSPSDQDLWRSIGLQIGLDQQTIEQYIRPTTSTDDESKDPLKEYGFNKIVIVSLQEKSAKMAVDHIKKRTGATVTVVSEGDAGDRTKEACSSDVILFVWSANKHAVYQAFDKVREKLAYVSGTGATSIVRSLEQWTIKNKSVV
jgi:hypothetical protein